MQAANHPLLLRNRWEDKKAISKLSKILHQQEYFGTDKSCTIELVKNEVRKMR